MATRQEDLEARRDDLRKSKDIEKAPAAKEIEDINAELRILAVTLGSLRLKGFSNEIIDMIWRLAFRMEPFESRSEALKNIPNFDKRVEDYLKLDHTNSRLLQLYEQYFNSVPLRAESVAACGESSRPRLV